MSGYYDDDEDFEQTQSGPKALRDQLAKLKDDLKKATEALEAERAQRAELDKKFKSTTLRDHLRDAGIDPKYASRAERDGVDATPESVKQWIEENKDVYVFLNKPAARDDDASGDDEQGDEDVVPDDLREGVEAGHRAESGSRPSGSKTVTEALASTKPEDIKSEAELFALLDSLGAPRPGE